MQEQVQIAHDNASWKVYSISDPRTLKVRYIGVTNDLSIRSSGHLTSARRTTSSLGAWILDLLNVGMTPTFTVLESGLFLLSNGKSEEKKWIQRYVGTGLLNENGGGGGPISRDSGVLMPCGWECGAKLSASGMRVHFTECPNRPPSQYGPRRQRRI